MSDTVESRAQQLSMQVDELKELFDGRALMLGRWADIITKSNDQFTKAMAEIKHLKQWISDLQSGMYINCVYCGHRYGPSDEVPAAMAEVLKQHVEQCPKHPMCQLKEKFREAQDGLIAAWEGLDEAKALLATSQITTHLENRTMEPDEYKRRVSEFIELVL